MPSPGVRTAAALCAASAVLPVLGQAPPPPTPSPALEKLSAEEIRGRERLALLAVNTVVQAEKAYAAANGSLFDQIRCLTAPAECIPSYPTDQPPFLDPTHAWLQTRLGYARKFHAGPKAADGLLASGSVSPSSLTAFAFTVSPTVPGRTGGRAFCGDSSGRTCVRNDGLAPPVKDGRCEPCQKLN
jgi:hypothetical protein